MAKTCQYFFAPQSPWAYLGHARFVALAKRHGTQIDLKPCDLEKVFDASGGLPLVKRPLQRQAYRLLELKRWSDFLRIPLNLQPRFFPVTPHAAARIIIAGNRLHGTDAALELTGAIMRAVWAEDRDIADPDTLAAIAAAWKQDGRALLELAASEDIQREYNRLTDEAVAANVFGSPWYIVDGEPFWGQDRLDFVERALAR